MSVDAELDGVIAATECRLRDLDIARESAARQLVELRERRQKTSPRHDGIGGPAAKASWTPERKVALFASLFRGRPDVFPFRWESLAKGKSGWAPRCDNEWKEGVCGKPHVRCGECPQQAFPAPTRDQLLAHLRGRQVMGIYPLLADDTCWLLAIDLDGGSWRADVRAICDSCRDLELVPAIERSRSGGGAHVWFFFSEPVAASLARRLGSIVLTDAMACTPTLSMASYDRLFPNQDTLPRGGFGNLIALPLQRAARESGNTMFLDERLEPLADQWSYLESLPRIAPARLQRILERRVSRAFSLPGMPAGPESDVAPWRAQLPLAARLVAAELPRVVSATLAQRLYVRRDGLPPALLDSLRRLAAFSNPKFLELQGMRLSTARAPRVIACFEEAGSFLVLPRGCLESLRQLLRGLEIELRLTDERSDGEPLDARFTGQLLFHQQRALDAMLPHEIGVLCAPPGSGKTVIAARMIAVRQRSTLVLVHRKPLLEQWLARLNEFLDLDAHAIGTIGGSRDEPSRRVDVAMVQSLARRDGLERLLADYGHVVVDECHHAPAVTTERVLRAAPARYVTGLTATPKRRDGHHPIIAMQCGPVRHTLEGGDRASSHALAMRVMRRDTPFDPTTLPTDASIQEVYGALAADARRTELIASDTLALVADGRCPIVLTERREHLERLAERLAEAKHRVIALHGDLRPREQRAAREQLAGGACPGGRVIVAIGRYVGEGFDDPRLDTLLLAMPIAWRGTVVQYAGRLHRAHPGKREVLVYDYVDAELPVLRRMFAKRLKAYRSLGYELVESA